MTRLSVWTVRAALFYLGVGLLIGALMLTQKGVPLNAQLLLWLPVHVELVLIGWTLQLAMGIAFWILPRFSAAPRYGNQTFGWLALAALNSGIWAVCLGQWLTLPLMIMLGRVAEFSAVIFFAAHAWPRVKPIGL